MMTLDDAWRWYRDTHSLVFAFRRLGRNHWDLLPWEGELGKDERFKDLDALAIVEDADHCLEHLNDFAVLILFSVFESAIRDRALSEVEPERGRLAHPLLIRMAEDAIEAIEHGPVFRVLELYKGRDVDLVEEVNQVRKYRNWVAHGRKTVRPDAVDPETAYERLKRFLDRMADPA